MLKTARYSLYFIAIVQFILAIAFFLQLPFAVNLWPFEGTTPLTFIFISSIFAAAAAPTLWAAATENYGVLAGIGLDYMGILAACGHSLFSVGCCRKPPIDELWHRMRFRCPFWIRPFVVEPSLSNRPLAAHARLRALDICLLHYCPGYREHPAAIADAQYHSLDDNARALARNRLDVRRRRPVFRLRPAAARLAERSRSTDRLPGLRSGLDRAVPHPAADRGRGESPGPDRLHGRRHFQRARGQLLLVHSPAHPLGDLEAVKEFVSSTELEDNSTAEPGRRSARYPKYVRRRCLCARALLFPR